MRTNEGIPIVENETLLAYRMQSGVRVDSSGSVNGVHIDFRRDIERLYLEQPALANFVELTAPTLSPENPARLTVFASQFYSLIKRQAEIDALKGASK